MKKKYTRANEEQAIIKMFQGLGDSAKSKIARARSFPTSIVDNFDLFKTYFLSGEGLPKVMDLE